MEADLCKRVEELFRAAQAEPPEKRMGFLKRVCPDDAEIRAEVQSLLDGKQCRFISGNFTALIHTRSRHETGSFRNHQATGPRGNRRRLSRE